MRKRKNIAVIYLSDAEQERLDHQVAHSGVSRQAFFMKLLDGIEIKPRPCDHHSALLKALSDISNDTDQLLHTLRANGQLSDTEIDMLYDRIKNCWKHIREQY